MKAYPLHQVNPDIPTIAEKIRSLEVYEKSAEVNPFSSRFDLWQKGTSELTEQEQRGFMLFVVESKGNCAACHPHTPLEDGTPALFTDLTSGILARCNF